MEKQSKELKEINVHVQRALSNWSSVTNDLEKAGVNEQLNYSSQDLINAFYIFTHVLKNVSYKIGKLTSRNSKRKTDLLLDLITKHFL